MLNICATSSAYDDIGLSFCHDATETESYAINRQVPTFKEIAAMVTPMEADMLSPFSYKLEQ